MNCRPKPIMDAIEIPNCDDPVFQAWCKACGLRPGELVSNYDTRVAKLQAMMQGYDATYDPYADPADDYLEPFPR